MHSVALDRQVGLADLADMTGPELVALYRELNPDSGITRFRDRATAISRVEKLLRAHKPAPAETPLPSPPPAPSLDGFRRRVRIEAPYSGRLKKWRPNSKRARLIEALTRGATIAECMETTGWDYRLVRENIMLLHKRVGFGLRESSDGKISLHTEVK